MWRGLLWLLGGCNALPNKGFSHFREQSPYLARIVSL